MNGAEHKVDDDARRPDVIGAVANALELLHLFSDGSSIHVGSASKRLGLSRSTVHRLLNTLSSYGYVDHDAVARVYRPGPVLTEIGLVAVKSSDLRSIGQAALSKLATLTNETAHLSVLRKDEILCIDSIESTQTVRTGSRTGWSLPAHATAAGRALLAELSDEEVLAIFPAEIIEKRGEARELRRIDLLAELELVRARRYATNFGESEPDVSAIGVVLRDRQNRARAALSITAPRMRGDDGWMRSAGAAALTVAAEFGGIIA
ncbi:IclR family transcriptional regulator [Glaciibacter flavus]|uniref:IclR family transcriptional regulator n=1 Tax=Orlajensenia flava TaxID=2565934 RepID=A0A4S4FQE0_9MICO|nr:IclR family transcriptional regulator [Glaciibacter flavus]THG32554.1 IclR family transcriptional regulator [Glaciibacter flavus]